MSETTMADPSSTLIVKPMDQPDEVRSTADRGQIDLVSLGQMMLGRATFQPGWRWSEHVKPIAGTDLCQATHVGYVVAGRQAVRMSDGTEVELSAGDAFLVGPGHDAWVVGDEACVTIDFVGGPDFATNGGQR